MFAAVDTQRSKEKGRLLMDKIHGPLMSGLKNISIILKINYSIITVKDDHHACI